MIWERIKMPKGIGQCCHNEQSEMAFISLFRLFFSLLPDHRRLSFSAFFSPPALSTSHFLAVVCLLMGGCCWLMLLGKIEWKPQPYTLLICGNSMLFIVFFLLPDKNSRYCTYINTVDANVSSYKVNHRHRRTFLWFKQKKKEKIITSVAVEWMVFHMSNGHNIIFNARFT